MKKLVAGILLATLSFSASAQDDKVVIIDRGPSYRSQRPPKERRLVDNNSVMKFSPLQMVVGEINFGYEKKLSETTSIEFELGPTLSNISFSVSENHYYDPYGSPYAQETSRIGFFGSVGYRFYPMDNGKVLNGFYVSPVLKYRLMNFGVTDYSKNLDDTKGSENDLNFTFNFGFQKWLSDQFSLDFFGGIGLAYESHIHYQVASVYDGNTGMYSYFWDRNAFTGVRYVLTGGVKIGIGN